MTDVAARLEVENEMLRARIEQLEEALGMRSRAPLCFGLTGSEAMVLGVLMRREMATKEMVMLNLYSGRPDDGAEIQIVTVFICHIRKKLATFGVKIETVWGQGYRLSPAMKARVRDLMQREVLAA